MKYNLEKAVSKLSWRFGSDKPFKPNQDDVEALNTIFGWINRQKKETLNNNVLFAKFYIHYKTMSIRRFETTVLDDFNVINNEMIKILKTPLNLFYEAFHRDLHDNQLNRLLEANNDKEKEEIMANYIHYKKTFTLDFVSNKLGHEITEALNIDFKL